MEVSEVGLPASPFQDTDFLPRDDAVGRKVYLYFASGFGEDAVEGGEDVSRAYEHAHTTILVLVILHIGEIGLTEAVVGVLLLHIFGEVFYAAGVGRSSREGGLLLHVIL